MKSCDPHAEFLYTSPLGLIRLGVTPSGLAGVRLLKRVSQAPRAGKPPSAARPYVRWLDGYFRGSPPPAAELAFDWSGATPFQARVWTALLKVPFGSVTSYSALAAAIGAPRAARAVARALAANPLPVFVPCHRVIRAGGALGGFSAGLPWKVRLLRHEGLRP